MQDNDIRDYSPTDFYIDVARFNYICNTFTDNPKDAKEKFNLYFNLIKEEFKELKDEVEAGNLRGVLEELADLNVVVTGLMQVMEVYRIGGTSHACYETAKNNLTKFPLLAELGVQEYEDLVKSTIELYAAKGITAIATEDAEGERLVFKNAETGKVLKPANYVPRNLQHLVDQPDFFKE